MSKHLYEFGPFRIDLTERLLLRDGQPVPLTPKAFETLLVLVQNCGHVVEKDELMKKVWPDTFVEEVGLARNISALRKVLEGGPDQHHYIETIPKRGYRFRSEVREWEEGNTDQSAEKKQSSKADHRMGSGLAADQAPGPRAFRGKSDVETMHAIATPALSSERLKKRDHLGWIAAAVLS